MRGRIRRVGQGGGCEEQGKHKKRRRIRGRTRARIGTIIMTKE
jgi:hypothetical protein